jgi:hypothetical protein
MTDEGLATLAAEGVTRVVVRATADDPAEQRDQLSRLADRFIA